MDTHFRIADLRVHPDRLVVVRDGNEIKLEPRMMQVLVTLAEHAGETMSTERLLIDVWRGTFYGDNPVNATISRLRKHIGDDSRKPRYIETISKVGYRLIAAVTLPEDYRRMPAVAEAWTNGSPYVGLSAFDAAHAVVFCGRSRMVANLLNAMRSQIENQRRFVFMVGPSGCGKTSLLRAGAIPLLTQPHGFDGLRALSVASCDLAAAHRGDVLKPLAEALATWTLDDRQVLPPMPAAQLYSALREAPEAIAAHIHEALHRDPRHALDKRPYAHLLLTIDHAEALVAAAEMDASARDAFARVLRTLCACPHTLVAMIARIDFYPKLIQAFPILAECKAGDGHLEVFSPVDGEISEIIRTPAWKANLTFETHPETRARLDDCLRDAARGQPDALPLLQHSLQMLYEQRSGDNLLTFAAYESIGGIEGAIAHRAEEVFSSLDTDVQDSLDVVLGKIILVQQDSDAVSARRVDLEVFDDAAKALINAFIDARLFVGGLRDGRPTMGVAHEALLRRWPRAVEWAQENRRLLLAKLRLHRASERWVEGGRQDDHLLNPGQPLAEAREVVSKFPDQLDGDARSFVEMAERAGRDRRRVRFAAMIALAGLSIASTIFAFVALQAKGTAEKRERESRRLIDYMLGPLAEELRQREMLGLLEKIGLEGIEYLEDRRPESMNQQELVRTATAYRTVGEALIDTENRPAAKKSFAEGYRLANLALARKEDDQMALFERGNDSFWLGRMDFDRKQYADAESHWNDYLKDSIRLSSLDDENPNWVMERSYAENNLGSLALRRGDTRVALQRFRASIALKARAKALDVDNLKYEFEYIDSLSWLASTLEASGQYAEAASQYDAQIDMLQSLIEKNKSANRWRSRLANYMMLSANVEIERDNPEKAVMRASEAVRILEGLSSIAPDNETLLQDLSKARSILANARKPLER